MAGAASAVVVSSPDKAMALATRRIMLNLPPDEAVNMHGCSGHGKRNARDRMSADGDGRGVSALVSAMRTA
ncbi:hypothetical protein GCM10023219_31240 [Stakelama sediminis]